MVGYTNVGKSTLLKLLSGADAFIEDRLFATLDTTVRMVMLNSSTKILLSDTVGFIRKLPSHLIASFKSTLAEAAEADILLHVVDVSHPKFEEQIAVVNATLDDLQASGKPTILVFNKIDTMSDRMLLHDLSLEHDNAVFISAHRGINIESLKDRLLKLLDENMIEHTVTIKQSDYRVIAKLHEIADITSKQYDNDSVIVDFRISGKNTEKLKKLFGHKTKLPLNDHDSPTK
jgi:GTP-binding protein HflX